MHKKERQRILSEAMKEFNARKCEKQSSCVNLASDRPKRRPESWEISAAAVKARVFHGAKEIAREIEPFLLDQLGPFRKENLSKRSVNTTHLFARSGSPEWSAVIKREDQGRPS